MQRIFLHHGRKNKTKSCFVNYMNETFCSRPDWDKCANLIPYWRNLSIGKSSDELVSDLINEIVQENNTEDLSIYNNEFSNKNTFFEQLSIASNFENMYHKNRHMRRRIIGLLIKEIWSNKVCVISFH